MVSSHLLSAFLFHYEERVGWGRKSEEKQEIQNI